MTKRQNLFIRKNSRQVILSFCQNLDLTFCHTPDLTFCHMVIRKFLRIRKMRRITLGLGLGPPPVSLSVPPPSGLSQLYLGYLLAVYPATLSAVISAIFWPFILSSSPQRFLEAGGLSSTYIPRSIPISKPKDFHTVRAFIFNLYLLY